MKKIYISDYLKEIKIEKNILSEFELIQNNKNLKDCIGAIIWHEKFPNDFTNLESIKAISRYGAGVDNIDLEFCKLNNIRVCNTTDYGIDEVSNTALAFLLWCSRGIGKYSNLSINLHDGSWESNIISSIRRIKTQTLGIIGLGRIGSCLALKAKYIGFNVIGFDPNQSTGHEKIIGIERVNDLEKLLRKSDYISLNCDLNPSTNSMVNIDFLNKLKPNASLINTARGSIINSIDEIFDKIIEGNLCSFATDVLPEEPPNIKIQNRIKDNLKLSQNVLITPHTAFYSLDSFEEMKKKAAKNLQNMLVNNFLNFEEKELFIKYKN